jgi:hypothetical protein
MYEIIFDKKTLEFLNKPDHKIKERIFLKIISTKEKPVRYDCFSDTQAKLLKLTKYVII